MVQEHNTKYKKKITIGYNGRDDFFDKVIEPFEYYISSVYTAPPKSFGITSARTVPDIDPEEMLNFRRRLKEKGIGFNLVFNFDGISDPDVVKNLLHAANYFKPDLVTVPSTFVMDLFIKKTDFKLNVSIINDINSINQLEQLLEKDNGGQIVSYNIGRRKTFDLNFIKDVRRRYPKLNLKLMVNEGCAFECPDQNFHSCSLTMAKKDFSCYAIFYCQKLAPNQYWRFLTGQYIPPKVLSNYCRLVDEMKIASRGIAGRKTRTADVVRILDEYVNEKDITIKRAMESSFGGSLFISGDSYRRHLEKDIFDRSYPEDFFKIRSSCKHNCYECEYCKSICECEHINRLELSQDSRSIL